MIDLKSKESLSVLLMAVAKKNGGEIRLTEAEMAEVSKTDAVALYWDNKKNEVVLRCWDTEDILIPGKTEYEN